MNTNNEVIIFDSVSKVYHRNIKPLQIRSLVTDLLKPKAKKAPTPIYSLKSASFNVYRGETVAIIGKNGSGKSTTLKMIAGICEPTEGRIEIRQKVTTMLSLGAGFHHDFSGRENIFLNGSLFGMTNYYLNSKVDEIIEFSELGDKIDDPVRTYSLGMLSRLGFSIAIQTQPEILLIDEVLAVGDNAFRQKCLKKFDEIKASSNTTIVLVTHDMEQVTKHCNRAIWLHQGQVMDINEPSKLVEKYLAY